MLAALSTFDLVIVTAIGVLLTWSYPLDPVDWWNRRRNRRSPFFSNFTGNGITINR
jgi:hypothetical protein